MFRLFSVLLNGFFVFASLVCVASEGGSGTAAGSGAAKFSQLGQELPTPGNARTASGAPGPGYWQQRVDYRIQINLDDERQRLSGKARITYHNRSPHQLKYLWLQMDQNRFRPDSDDVLTATAPNFDKLSYKDFGELLERQRFDGGFNISRVVDSRGKPLPHKVVKTMMRVDLPKPLKAGESFVLQMDWSHNVLNLNKITARGGYEYFEKDGNYLYVISQWFPRLAAYTDYDGWNHKQFLGRGEFTLELGDYEVSITAPADHIVASSGELQNASEVLTDQQRRRFTRAKNSDRPVFIVTPEEALKNEASKSNKRKTWVFKADNVRDFAWASSRKFVWDAMGVESGGRTVMAMSYYPGEVEKLWSKYSTAAIAHTIETYSSYTFDYPYPVAISVNGPVAGGMEYPMISFNRPRPYKDDTYWGSPFVEDAVWDRSKYGLISVVIHEVGHNYFPMIVNSDERQWTWMDEGLNSFLQFLSERTWEPDYPARRGEPRTMAEYMTSANQVPIMTNSESILQFSNNAYGKPATALNILRESILGRELFDHAFREYARRWKFKRPTPSDFFRTMEDASGIDLDWFWRGWFYGTDHVDVAIEKISLYRLDSRDPDKDKPRLKELDGERPRTLTEQRNKGVEMRVDRYPELKDFYNDFDKYAVTPYDRKQYENLLKDLEDREKALLQEDKYFYTVNFRNIGGLVTPLPLKITYADNSVEQFVIPAEIWRRNAEAVSKLIIADQEIRGIEFDPYRETADTDISNNAWPMQPVKSRFQLFKKKEKPNHMLRMTEEGIKEESEQ